MRVREDEKELEPSDDFMYSHEKDVNRGVWPSTGAFASHARGPKFNLQLPGIVDGERKKKNKNGLLGGNRVEEIGA